MTTSPHSEGGVEIGPASDPSLGGKILPAGVPPLARGVTTGAITGSG